jgi:hypothetical protein
MGPGVPLRLSAVRALRAGAGDRLVTFEGPVPSVKAGRRPGGRRGASRGFSLAI